MRQIIAGNWKMNGTLADVGPYGSALKASIPACLVVICPPFPLLPAFAAQLTGTGIALGAQDCHTGRAGAHTGDVSGLLIKEIGAHYVILGHSERRNDHFESNAIVRAKVEAALQAALVPIVCVGETDTERDAGEAEDVVRTQLIHSLPPEFTGLVAYEPIWAIGTGRTPTEADIIAMHGAIRHQLTSQFPQTGAKIPILYGGSVKPANAAAILALPEVGGALVGGASLKATEFLAIAACAASV
jgi:triosephosphate isomerase